MNNENKETRKMLEKLRDLEKTNKTISLTEADSKEVKELLNKKPVVNMDIIFGKKVLTEEEKTESQLITPEEQKEEEEKFKNIVSSMVKFNKIKVYPENVEWSGHLIREKIYWVFSLDETVGVYVGTEDLLQLKDDTLETLRKLRAYYDVFVSDWSKRLTIRSNGDESESGESEKEK